jgi:hypothetical protein
LAFALRVHTAATLTAVESSVDGIEVGLWDKYRTIPKNKKYGNEKSSGIPSRK